MDLGGLKTELRLRNYSPKTSKIYEYFVGDFFSRCKKNIASVDKNDVKSYMGYLMEDREYKATSVNLALSALRFFFEEVNETPFFRDIKKPKRPQKVPTVLTKDEIAALFGQCKTMKQKLLLGFMYGSGLRVSEVVNLRKGNFELNDAFGSVLSGKGQKDRLFILPKNLISDLRTYFEEHPDLDYLFPGRDGGLMTVRNVQILVKRASKRAGITKRVFCHALRSSFATHLLERGTDIRVIQELLGHANLQTTQVYTKVSREQLKKVVSPFD